VKTMTIWLASLQWCAIDSLEMNENMEVSSRTLCKWNCLHRGCILSARRPCSCWQLWREECCKEMTCATHGNGTCTTTQHPPWPLHPAHARLVHSSSDATHSGLTLPYATTLQRTPAHPGPSGPCTATAGLYAPPAHPRVPPPTGLMSKSPVFLTEGHPSSFQAHWRASHLPTTLASPSRPTSSAVQSKQYPPRWTRLSHAGVTSRSLPPCVSLLQDGIYTPPPPHGVGNPHELHNTNHTPTTSQHSLAHTRHSPTSHGQSRLPPSCKLRRKSLPHGLRRSQASQIHSRGATE
jgi:hypothetical protein